jgi:aminomethyltransferase
MNQRTPFYDLHVAAGGKMIPFAGWEMPVRYTGDTAEHMAVREKAGLFDVSHMGEFLIRGPQAVSLLQQITTNDVAKLPVGKAQYNCLPNLSGGIVDDIIVYRLENELFLMVVNAANIEKDWNWINSQNQEKGIGAVPENISAKTALLAVSGPNALAIVQSLCQEDITSMKYYEVKRTVFNNHPNVLVATTGYTGEKTYEIMFDNALAQSIWTALITAGQQHGLTLAGLGARDTLRLEMGYMLYGNDITDQTSPLAAGLSWITKLNKGVSFNSSAIFAAQKAQGLPEKLVAFEMLETGIPRHDYLIAYQGKTIGKITSGTFSPCLKKGIGMAYVATEHSEVGTEFDVMIRDKPTRAVVTTTPFIKQTSLSDWMRKS